MDDAPAASLTFTWMLIVPHGIPLFQMRCGWCASDFGFGKSRKPLTGSTHHCTLLSSLDYKMNKHNCRTRSISTGQQAKLYLRYCKDKQSAEP